MRLCFHCGIGITTTYRSGYPWPWPIGRTGSLLRKSHLHFPPPRSTAREIPRGVYRFQPVLLGQRLNALAPLRSIQVSGLRAQIDRAAADLDLREPLFFYFHMKQMFPLLTRLKGKRFLAYVCMDYGQLRRRRVRQHLGRNRGDPPVCLPPVSGGVRAEGSPDSPAASTFAR